MKPSKILLRVALVAVFAVLLTACEKNFDVFNSNPNASNSADPQFVLPGAQVDLSYFTDYQMEINYIGLWVQQHASGAYPEEDQYSPRLADLDFFWNNLYDNSLKDLRHIIDTGSANEVAVAKILSAYAFMYITDVWGDIPYSLALQGENGGTFLTPSFDSQKDVYSGILKDLDDAVKLIDRDNAAEHRFGAEDLIYGGDLDLWEKFANSLRLRAFIHLSEVDEATSKAGVIEMLGKPLISSNAENAYLHYATEDGNRNPVHSRFTGRPNDFRMSKSMIDRLIGSGDEVNPADPRTHVYSQRNDSSIYIGIPNGINGLGDVGLTNGTTCMLGTAFLAPDAPAYFMRWTEVEFIRAEAIARGWIAGDAKMAYEDAIWASMDEHGITDANIIADFLADPNVAFESAKAMELISTQKWIALFSQANESWTNFRRTGFPALPVALNDQNNGKFPVRFTYPTVEATTNGDNVKAATTSQGGAELADPLWWDK